VTGSLTPKIRDDRTTVAFVDARGAPVLLLRDLRATDADGREVDLAWMSGAAPAGTGGRMRLLVPGASHAFPIGGTRRVAPSKSDPSRSASAAAPSLAPLAPPANDQCSGAEVIPAGGPFPYTSGAYDITDATTTGDPSPPTCQPSTSHSIWFK